VDGDGNAVLDTAVGPLLLEAPVAWQIGTQGEDPVEVQYVLDGPRVRLALGLFDPEREIFIDPVVSYQLSIGGSELDAASAVAIDAAGNAYVAGHTRSSDFPTTPGAFDQTVSSFFGARDAFVMKRDATGALVWSTALGGIDALASDAATAIALDSLLRPVVAGWTTNCYFASAPTPCSTTIPIATMLGEPNAFVAKLDADGSGVVFARNFGGSDDDRAQGVATSPAAAAGDIVVVGRTESASFPLAGTHVGGMDAFVARFSSAGDLEAAYYLGGLADDEATAVVLDSQSIPIVAGTTFSSNFPSLGSGTTYSGGGDAFVTKFAVGNSLSLEWSRFHGTSAGERGVALASGTAASDAIFLAGNRVVSLGELGTLPTSPFVAQIVATGALTHELVLGRPQGDDHATAIAYSSSLSRVYVAGYTNDASFPVAGSLAPYAGGASDAFVATLAVSPSAPVPVAPTTFLGTSDADQAHGIALRGSQLAVAGLTGTGSATNAFLARIRLAPAFPDAYSVNEDTSLFVAAPGVLANDDLGGLALKAVVATAPSQAASFSLQPDGSFAYTPVADFFGTDSFAYALVPAGSGSTPSPGFETVTVTITVATLNDAPSFVTGPNQIVLEDATAQNVAGWATSISAGPANESAQTLSFSTASDNGGLFSAQPAVDSMGSLTYTLAPNANGVAMVTVTLSDSGGMSAAQTLLLTVRPVNDAPSFVAGANQVLPEDAGAQTVAAGATSISAGPANESAQALTFSAATDDSSLFSVQPTVSSTGTLTYTPAANAFGVATVTVTLSDSGGVLNGGVDTSATQTFTVTVTSVSDAPFAANDGYSLSEDTSLSVPAPGVLGNDFDAEGDAFTARLVSGPAHGTLLLQAAGDFLYTPEADFFGTDSFRYVATDGSMESPPATVTLTVVGVNDAPTSAADAFIATEDTPLIVGALFGVLANDSDLDSPTLAAMLLFGPAHGSLSLAADGSFTYTPGANYFGTDSFTYAAGDGDLLSSPTSVNITIAGAPDAPVALDDPEFQTSEDGTLAIASAAGVLANDNDPDGDTAIVEIFQSPEHGALTLAADGGFSYTPVADFFGVDTFQYRLSDGTSFSNIATATITVTNVNDTPVAVADVAATDEGYGTIIEVLANDSGLGDTPVVVTVGPASMGTAQVNPDRTITYMPAPDLAGFDSFTYTLRDDDGQSSSARVTVEVRPFQATGPELFGAWASVSAQSGPFCTPYFNDPFADGLGRTSTPPRAVNCGSREDGPWAEASVQLVNDKDWTLHARTAASRGTPDDFTAGYAFPVAFDTYTVLPGTSGLSTGTRVPVFVRVRNRRTIQNPPFSRLVLGLQVLRKQGASATVILEKGEQFSVDGNEDTLKDVRVPGELEMGTRLKAFWTVDAFAESGGDFGSLVDPKVAEADVSISLCSAVAGVIIQGASGAVGDCAGDLEILNAEVEPIQSVRGADTMVAGKDTVLRLDLVNTFSSPIKASVTFTIERPPFPNETFTEAVTIPPGCPTPKRYYFPSAETDPTADPCSTAQARSGLRSVPSANLQGLPPLGQEPIAFASFKVSAEFAAVDTLIESDPNNNTGTSGTLPVKETLLESVYTQVSCLPGHPCDADPADYGGLDPLYYEQAVASSDAFTMAAFPVGPDGYLPKNCETCVVPGNGAKCTGSTVDTCTGIVDDIKRAFLQGADSSPTADRAIMMFPANYLIYHQYPIPADCVDPPDVCRAGVKGFFIRALADQTVAVSGADAGFFPLRPYEAHELIHSYGLLHATNPPPPWLSLPSPLPSPLGYWVNCQNHLVDDFPLCDVPFPGSQNLMARKIQVDAPRVWTDRDTYQHLLGRLKVGVDPVVLLISGELTKDGVVSIHKMREFPEGKVTDQPKGELYGPEARYSVEMVDDAGNVLDRTSLGYNFSTDLEGEEQPLRFVLLQLKLLYPPATAIVRFKHKDQVLLDVDPLSQTLRGVIEDIPSRAFDQNPDERRKALLNMIDAFEKMTAKTTPKQGALQKIEQIREKVEKWVVGYTPQPGESLITKEKALAQIDHVAARLRTRVRTPDSAAEPSPSPSR